jgi:adenine-specific DNA-methyltransferase
MAIGNTVLDSKARIEAGIKAFRSGSFSRNAANFFDALGYRSERTAELEPNTPEGLLGLVNRPDFFNRKNARPEEWASIDLLFQLTDEEVRDYGQTSLDFDSKQLDMDSDRSYQSYLFFAVQLKKDSYNRTALAEITREINRFFDMPALVLFKHGKKLTLAVINRRLHKRDSGRDVLEKVTLIKDISVESPHRAHIEILYDLAFPQLTAKYEITNFVKLHDAWRATLDISELNKRFYKDLSNWYFWARELVKFPAQPGVTDEESRATNVIRLITRLTFVWFLKERGLVPDDLFRRESLEATLTDLSPKTSTFYKAILQNLFFATLNTPMSDPASPREFRKDTDEGKRFNDQYMVHNQYRHKKLFRDPDAALGMFASVPFLNGGLFESLDKREEINGKLVEIRVDGFSDLEKKQPTVPNRLFFCDEHSCADDGVDLNEVYGTRKKQYRVRGLIDTLNRYKFTVAENTPLDEEVALDPELLGKVFENLLASYNPETGATARKQTGSFYTPREIVNYMVDESLIAYLETRLAPVGGHGQAKSTVMRERDAQASFIGQQPFTITEAAATRAEGADGESLSSRLRQLFAYTDEPHRFTDGEVGKLIRAIDEVKILDPACGSGAYPMGILGKLVFILSKLDPQNARWKQRQIDRVHEAIRAAEKIEDDKFRESALQDLRAQIDSIEEAFRNNELDYGRKLFLIENCIYGVDIQPIAIQISKLRFFISLIIDQKIRAQAENLGIRPLPNLETKFVAANTLLGIEKPAQSMLQNEELRQAIEEKERELKIVRERHFTARTTRTKEKHRRDDERLRREIGKLLEEDNWSPETAAKLIRWNPYDQNATADFFDPEWIFGVTEGFDIVIGNPPYIKEYTYRQAFDGIRDSPYYQGKMDIWYFFACKGIDYIREKTGVLSFIATNNWVTNAGASVLRNKIVSEVRVRQLIDFGELKVFESAGIQTMVMLFTKNSAPAKYQFELRKLTTNSATFADALDLLAKSSNAKIQYLNPVLDRKALLGKPLVFSNNSIEAVLDKVRQKSNFSLNGKTEVIQGIVAPQDFVNAASKAVLGGGVEVGDGIFIISDAEKRSMDLSNAELELVKPLYTTTELSKYYGDSRNTLWVIYTDSSFKHPDAMKPYPKLKKHMDKFTQIITSDNHPYGLHRSRNEQFFKGEKIISLRKCFAPTFTYTDFDCYVSQTFNVIKTNRVNLKFLTGLLNSRVSFFWLKHKGKIQGKLLQIDKEPLLAVPLLVPTKEQQKPVIELIDRILAAKRKNRNADTSELEREIDRLLYQLYDLTPEEIEIVEASAGR